MQEPLGTGQKADLRDYLAAERTLLAWVRTGLALMGFGFVVARFGLFLRELQIAQGATSPPSYGLSLWFGTALIGAGIVVNLVSGWQHARLIWELDRGRQLRSRSSTHAVTIALFLALVGLAMATYLISVRGATHSNSRNSKEASMAPNPDNGMVHLSSPHSVVETVKRLESLLQAQGIAVFCRIDHSGEAQKADLKMSPTQVVIFGSPKSGTPVMVASPTLAIDLPLKALIWEDGGGKVWVSYNSPDYLKQRHNIPEELVKNIAGIGPLLHRVVE